MRFIVILIWPHVCFDIKTRRVLIRCFIHLTKIADIIYYLVTSWIINEFEKCIWILLFAFLLCWPWFLVVHFKTEIVNILPLERQRTCLSAVCVPTGLLNYIKHWNARSSKKVFWKKAKYRLYDNFSPSNLYEKESFFIHYTLSSLFEKPCSEKCRLYSFLAKFVLNWITAATIYCEEEPGNSISMLKLERNTKIEKKNPHNSIF